MAKRSTRREVRRNRLIIAGLTTLGASGLSLLLVVALLSASRPVCDVYPEHIGLACVALPRSTSYRCTVTSSPVHTEIHRAGIDILDSAGARIGGWKSPITFGQGGMTLIDETRAPLATNSSIIDEGSESFGRGDYIFLHAEPGQRLAGSVVKVYAPVKNPGECLWMNTGSTQLA